MLKTKVIYYEEGIRINEDTFNIGLIETLDNILAIAFKHLYEFVDKTTVGIDFIEINFKTVKGTELKLELIGVEQ